MDRERFKNRTFRDRTDFNRQAYIHSIKYQSSYVVFCIYFEKTYRKPSKDLVQCTNIALRF